MEFHNTRYISLRTKRRNSQKVDTPLWLVIPPKDNLQRTIYAFTNARSGKVKRIKNNCICEIAICTLGGRILSEWIKAEISIVKEEQFVRQTIKKMYQKYSWQMFLVDILARIGRRRSCWVALKINY